MRTITDAQAKACAFHIVDIIETKARAFMAQDPRLDIVRASALAIDAMTKKANP
jgi:hypothetical protein